MDVEKIRPLLPRFSKSSVLGKRFAKFPAGPVGWTNHGDSSSRWPASSLPATRCVNESRTLTEFRNDDMVWRSLPDHTVAYNRISNRQFVKFAAVESDRDGAVMHMPEAGVYFGEGQPPSEFATAAQQTRPLNLTF